MTRFVSLFFAFLFTLIPAVAFAADAANGTVVDLSSLLGWLIQALGAVLLGVGTWAATWAANYFKLSQDSAVRAYLDEALKNGVSYAMNKLGAVTADLGKVDVKNQILAEAASYAAAHVPDALKFFGLNSDPAALARLITARLPGAAAQPATASAQAGT